jgi:AcrR family transcriptional regulator
VENISRKERERLTREKDILNAAEKIFSSRGIEEASMEEIAKEAQFTRKTIYQYFGNKDELLAAVTLRGYKMLSAYFLDQLATGTDSYEKLRILGRAYYQFYKNHNDAFRLINYSGVIKSKGTESQKKDLEKLDQVLFQIVSTLINDGKIDGSIRSNIDTMTTTYSVIFLITGFFYELSLSGKTFTENLSLELDHFVFYTLDLILESLHRK